MDRKKKNLEILCHEELKDHFGGVLSEEALCRSLKKILSSFLSKNMFFFQRNYFRFGNKKPDTRNSYETLSTVEKAVLDILFFRKRKTVTYLYMEQLLLFLFAYAYRFMADPPTTTMQRLKGRLTFIHGCNL
jgi:hypothetical protein